MTDEFFFFDAQGFSATADANHAPRLVSHIRDQAARLGDPFSFTLPTSSFNDEDAGDKLTYSATLVDADGHAIQTFAAVWVSFDSATLAFSGTPTGSDSTTFFKVTATDSHGVSVSDIFAIVIKLGVEACDLVKSTRDVLVGGSGGEVLDGGKGADRMSGGGGDDLYIIDHAMDTAVEISGEGTDEVCASVSHTLGDNIENLTLTGAGNLRGTGNTGNNILMGNAGNNTLAGLAGADTLDGGAGADKLSGGAGADTFVFSAAPEKGRIDSITDFSAEDVLEFSTSIFTKLAVATAANLVLGTSAVDPDDYLIYNSKTGKLYYDEDGNGSMAAVQIAGIKGTGAKALSIDDFSFV